MARRARRLRPVRPAGAARGGRRLPALARARGDRLSRRSGGSCAPSSSGRLRTRDSSSASGRFRRECSATTCAGWPTAVSSVSWRRPPRRASGIPRAGRSLPERIRSRSGSRARPASRSWSTSRWGRSRGGTSSQGSRRRTTSSPSAASRRTRRSRSPSACSCSSTRSCATPGTAPFILVARPEADPVPALRTLAAGVRLPGDS